MKSISLYLIGVLIALLVVGFESGTILRHVIQVIPIILSIILVWQRFKWSSFFALGVFTIWFLIMCCIWLHLLNITHPVNGTFTVIEIILTIGIGMCCVSGMLNSIRNAPKQNPTLLLSVLITSLALQFGFVVLSMQPAIAYK